MQIYYMPKVRRHLKKIPFHSTLEAECANMDFESIRNVFERFGTIYYIGVLSQKVELQKVRIVYWGNYDASSEKIIESIQWVMDWSRRRILDIHRNIVGDPWFKIASRQPMPPKSQIPSVANNIVNKLDDDCLHMICTHLAVMDLCALGATSQRLQGIAAESFRRRYRAKALVFEDMMSNGFVPCSDMKMFAKVFNDVIPKTFQFPEEVARLLDDDSDADSDADSDDDWIDISDDDSEYDSNDDSDDDWVDISDDDSEYDSNDDSDDDSDDDSNVKSGKIEKGENDDEEEDNNWDEDDDEEEDNKWDEDDDEEEDNKWDEEYEDLAELCKKFGLEFE